MHRVEDDNKSLLLENQKLKEKAERRPFLTISMAVDEGVDEEEKEQSYYRHRVYIRIDEDDTVHLKVSKINTNTVETEYYPVRCSDFPSELRIHISDKEIEDYNKAFPSKEVLGNYLEEYKDYMKIQKFGVAITLYK